MIKLVKKLAKQLLGMIPTALPNGNASFDAWVEDIRSTYNMPTEDLDSIKFAFATMIMHLGPTTAYKPKLYFALAIKAGAAKQVAGSVFHQVKEAQAARQRAAVTATIVANELQQ